MFSEAVDDEPFLTVQNPADVVGETVFDCRPSVLPVSIPLLGLGPGMMAEARPTGKSIMDMDTNEITISRIVGFEWNDEGTDLEDEGPTAVASPVKVVTDPFGHGDNFDFDLAKVMCDVSVIPSIITPIEGLEVQPPSMAAEYAALATPAFEGYTVPEDSGLAWIQGFAPVSETVLDKEDGHWLSMKGSASTSGSVVDRDTGCGSSSGRAGCTDDAADPGRHEDQVRYGRCPTGGSGTGVRGGIDRGVHLSATMSSH